MLKSTPRHKPAIRQGSKIEPRDNHPTLADLGLDKKTSMLAQRVANLSPEQFKDVQASTYSPCSESCSGMSGEMGGNLGKLGEGLKGLSPSVHAVMLMFS